MNSKSKQYFDNLTPGKVIQMSEAKDPAAFKQAAMEYIDTYGHSIGFVNDYQAIVKYRKIPKNEIGYFFIY